MRVLLDTHAFLWFVLDDPKLSDLASSLISDPQNEVLVSPASFWEIAIKVSLEKYRLPEPFEEFIQRQSEQNDFSLLPITVAHTAAVSTLPFHHRDPFDRMLVAQSFTERVPLLSADTALDAYPIHRLW